MLLYLIIDDDVSSSSSSYLATSCVKAELVLNSNLMQLNNCKECSVLILSECLKSEIQICFSAEENL
jgi:hypothetical protein